MNKQWTFHRKHTYNVTGGFPIIAEASLNGGELALQVTIDTQGSIPANVKMTTLILMSADFLVELEEKLREKEKEGVITDLQFFEKVSVEEDEYGDLKASEYLVENS